MGTESWAAEPLHALHRFKEKGMVGAREPVAEHRRNTASVLGGAKFIAHAVPPRLAAEPVNG